MEPIPEAEGAPQIVGGVPANGSDWPATFKFRTSIGNCTSTAIGPQVILTAAHCIRDGSSGTVRTASGSVSVKCFQHPTFAIDTQFDIALCKANSPIRLANNAQYETLNTNPGFPRVDDTITLLGFGCRQLGNTGPSGSLYTGGAVLKGFMGITLRTYGGAAVCKGDSGGASYAFPNSATKRIVGINSRGGVTLWSTLAPIASPGIMSFLLGWSDTRNLKICGLHTDAENCLP